MNYVEGHVVEVRDVELGLGPDENRKPETVDCHCGMGHFSGTNFKMSSFFTQPHIVDGVRTIGTGAYYVVHGIMQIPAMILSA